MGNAKYPQELFLRVITVSLETMKVVEGLPVLSLENDPRKIDFLLEAVTKDSFLRKEKVSLKPIEIPRKLP